jgi:phage terminase small subunit
VRLKRTPKTADAIARRLIRDVPGITAADMLLVEDTARWASVGALVYDKLFDANGELQATTTDTAHGNKEEARKNPLLIVLRTASEQLRANVQQLGASPLARARLPEPEGEDESIADVLFAGLNRMDAGAKRRDDGG